MMFRRKIKLNHPLIRFHRFALMVSRLGLTANALEGLAAVRKHTDSLDPTAFTVDISQSTPQPLATLDRLLRLARLTRFRDQLTEHQQERVFELIQVASTPDASADPVNAQQRYTELLAELTGWAEEQIKALVGDPSATNANVKQGLLAPVFPSHFHDERLPLEWRLRSYGSLGGVDWAQAITPHYC